MGKRKGDYNMEFTMIITPILIAGVIGLYVISSLKHLANEGKLGKRKSKGAQSLLHILIPIGMMFGGAIGFIFGLVFQLFLPFTISLGTSIGYLLGFLHIKVIARK